MLAIGVLAALAQLLQAFAYRLASTHRVAPIGYFSLVVAIGLGWLIFGNVPDPWAIVGMAIIAVSGLIMALR